MIFEGVLGIGYLSVNPAQFIENQLIFAHVVKDFVGPGYIFFAAFARLPC